MATEYEQYMQRRAAVTRGIATERKAPEYERYMQRRAEVTRGIATERKAPEDELKELILRLEELYRQFYTLEQQVARIIEKCKNHSDIKTCEDDDDCMWGSSGCDANEAHHQAATEAMRNYDNFKIKYRSLYPNISAFW